MYRICKRISYNTARTVAKLFFKGQKTINSLTRNGEICVYCKDKDITLRRSATKTWYVGGNDDMFAKLEKYQKKLAARYAKQKEGK